ncbi:MAG: hypothetical protein AB1925_24085 [Actinomycetota bacterium]
MDRIYCVRGSKINCSVTDFAVPVEQQQVARRGERGVAVAVVRIAPDRRLVHGEDDSLSDVVVQTPRGEGHIPEVESRRQRGQLQQVSMTTGDVQHGSPDAGLIIEAPKDRQGRLRIGSEYHQGVVARSRLTECIAPWPIGRSGREQRDDAGLPIGGFEDVQTVMNRLRHLSIVPAGYDISGPLKVA